MMMTMLMLMKMMKWVGEWSQVRRGKEETRDFHLAEKPPFFSLHHCEEVVEEDEGESIHSNSKDPDPNYPAKKFEFSANLSKNGQK